jgi:replication initiation and membrane attachment protein
MLSLEDNAVFTIKAPSSLTGDEEDILVKCYLPLVGPEAFSLYHVLLSMRDEAHSSYASSLDLAEKMGTPLAKLSISFRALEAAGLVSTFRHEDASKVNYIYRIFAPLNPSLFFKNEMLTSVLINKVGERRVKEIISSYSSQEKIPEDYVDVSARFSDVFDDNIDYSSYERLSGEELNLALNEGQAPSLAFDKEEFKDKLKELSVDPACLSNSLDDIASSSSLYAVSPADAAALVKSQCLVSDGSFSYPTFLKAASDFFHYHLDREEESGHLEDFGTSDAARRLKSYNSLSPITLLAIILKSEPTKANRDLLYKLSDVYKLENPVINVIADYTVQKCDGFFNEKYALAITSAIKANDIHDASSAFTFLYQNNRKQESSKRKKKDFEDKILSDVNKKEGQKKEEKVSDVNLDEIIGEDI